MSPLFQSELDYIRQNLSQYIDTSRSALENAQSLLDPNAPSNIWVIVAKVKDVATVVHGLLDLFDWDVYYPMEDEGYTFVLLSNSVGPHFETSRAFKSQKIFLNYF